jgi:hypothetical protein
MRRARWGAAGAANDVRLHRRAVIVATLLICGFTIAFALVLHAG